jgi:hypothetical protein
MQRSAVFSDCGRFRHILRRSWDVSRPSVGYICLNPSIAGSDIDDPSVMRMVGFADRLGFGGFSLANLYDFIATDPKDLKRGGFQRSPEADEWIRRVVQETTEVICAWGAHARGLSRPDEVMALLRGLGVRPKALALTADGIPRHPLMLPYSCELIELETAHA